MDGETIVCAEHGEVPPAYVCSHLLGNSVGLGFFRNDPTDGNPFPDAWCGDCEIIRETQGGWNEESEKHIKISLICSNCYQAARIRNTQTTSKLSDLDSLRWKCSTCDKWHYGACLDFGHSAPHYWSKEYDKTTAARKLLPKVLDKRDSFLEEEFCVIEKRDFFVRGIIHIPILGTNETFRWGVWGSLSEPNFRKLTEMHKDSKRVELPPMFSWLSTEIEGYPSTLSLKTYLHVKPIGNRPHFEIEHSAHPLAQEFHHGITPDRVRELMFTRLRDVQT